MPLRRRAAAFAAHAARKTVGAGLMALAGAAVMGVAGVGPASWVASASAAMFVPDPVFAGTLTAAQQAEMKAWGQAYFNKIEGVNQGGSNAVTAAWTFATPAMNSPLFNPFYGPRQTLVNLDLIADTDCPRALTEAAGADAASQAKRGAIKDALVNFKFKTYPVTDPNGTTAHVIKILDSTYVSGLVTYTQAGKLVSEKLPLDVLEGAGVSVQFADNLSDSSITALLVLTSQAPGIVANAVGATEAQAMVSGQGTKADSVALTIAGLLQQAGIAGSTVLRMDAIFGVYGQLPIVYIILGDCAVLIDATTGAVSLPMKPGSALDASGLLALHSIAAASPFPHRLITKAGCTVTLAPSWQTTPPGPGPGLLTPAVPIPQTPTGGGGTYTCTMPSNSKCVCTRNPTFINPPGITPLAPTSVRTVCTYSGPTCLPPGSGCAGATPSPTYPTGNPGIAPGNSQGCIMTCVTEYLY